MDKEQARLKNIASKVPSGKRKEIADMLNAELVRRESEKRLQASKTNIHSSGISGDLPPEQMAELYSDVEENVRQLRIKKLERQIEDARKDQERMSKHLGTGKPSFLSFFKLPQLNFNFKMPAVRAPETMVMYGVAAFGVAKILFSSGLVNATIYPGTNGSVMPKLVLEQPNLQATVQTSDGVRQQLAPLDKDLLTQLDGRRAELDKRNDALNQREGELKDQEQTLADKLAELRSLTEQVKLARKEREQHYEGRLQQLASVYGSMAPAEAAPLMAKLDQDISLALLELMPEKRMGQILSSMSPDQAIKLTTKLSERGKL